ncbi:TraB/GumN family protein [Glacieibacterium sp.]|uniref:TraB/GumN family protein n=1 Tax=Glacieibacterium sp. TaxID=2860237 RepID=UPI003AFF950F
MRFLFTALALFLAVPAAAEPAMWRVANATTEIILFGTVHELPEGTTWLTPRIQQRFDAADALVLETVVPDDRSVIGQLITRMGYSPREPKLITRVAPSRRGLLLPQVREVGLPIEALDAMETWYAAVALGDAAVSRIGLDPALGVEPILTARARTMKKPITGLETPEQQLGYFDNLPETDQRAMLDSTLDDMRTAKTDTANLIAAWLKGDTNALAADFAKSMRATPRLASVLVTERNARWANWVEARLKLPGKVFIAVGAAHLTGRDSVQAMLAAKGIKVERLP